MKKPLRKNNVKNIIAIGASLAILCGIVATGIVKNGLFSAELTPSPKESSDEKIEDHGLNVKYVKTIQGDGQHLTKIFTYSITPSNASKEVTLSIFWEDSSYTEDTDDYFETSIDTGSCEISIKCIKAFDHVALAKVTSIIDPDLNASITLNYVQKFLGFLPRDDTSNGVMRIDTLSTDQGPRDEASFMKLITEQSTAYAYPAFSDVYTKEYPAGHTASYEAYYKKSKCYSEHPDLGQETEQRYEAAMKAVEEEAGGVLWTKQTQAGLIEGIAKVYEKMSYNDQRLLNEAGYIGIRRLYTTTVSLGEESYPYPSYWVLRVDVKSLRSYLADVTVSLEETNLDF